MFVVESSRVYGGEVRYIVVMSVSRVLFKRAWLMVAEYDCRRSGGYPQFKLQIIIRIIV